MRRKAIAYFWGISLFFSLLSIQTKAQVNKVYGFYVSNFPISEFFTTQIQLNTDSTFKYEWWGDMRNDLAIGSYEVNNDTILLTYIPSKYDTLYFWKDDTTGADTNIIWHYKTYNPTKQDHAIKLKNYDLVSYIGNRPLKFYYKHQKLLLLGLHKAECLSRHKMFLLFGKHYRRTKKYYLKKLGSKGEFSDD